MADLDEALAALVAEDPDMADLEDLVGQLLTPQLDRFEKEHVEPLAKVIEEVSIKAEPITASINDIDSMFKSTRVMAEDLQSKLLKEKMEIDQLIMDSKDAHIRTENNESQLFQSKISATNPFNLFYLYRSLDKKSHSASLTTNTTTTSSTASSQSSSSGVKKSSHNQHSTSHSHVDVSGPSLSKGNETSQHTKVASVPRVQTNKEPELIDLCGGMDEVAQLDPDSFTVPEPEQLMTKTAEIARGMKLLAKKKGVSDLNEWFEATLLNIITDQGNKKFKVKFDTMGKRLLSGKHIALKTHPTFEQLKMGSRVVASYSRISDGDKAPSLYTGIIAELPMITNKGRFLIFYDVGYAQYVDLEDMYLVYQPATKVWEDDMGDSKDFIMKYLNRYPERPMVRLALGQWAKTEWNGVWWRAKVKKVDGSLALMHFESDDREEWIYRGSPRLEPLFSELQKAEEAKRSGNTLVASGTSNPHKRRRPTRVEYTIVMKQQLVMPRNAKNVARKSTSVPKSPEVRKKKGQTAVKSTSLNREHHKKHHHHRKSPSPTPTPDVFELDDSEENSRSDSLPASNISNEGASSSASPSPYIPSQPLVHTPRTNPTVAELLSSPSTLIMHQQQQQIHQQQDPLQQLSIQYQQHQQQLQYQQQQQQYQQQQQQQQQKTVKRKKRKNQKSFVAHTCNYYCVINCWPPEQNKTFNKNPLRLPEICGWSRELAKIKGSGKRHVVYRTPCGRILRGMDEINRYLKETSINYLSVDHFTFDPFVYTLTRKPRVKPIWKIDDISKGAEPMPVSCVNELDSSPLPSVEYVAHRLPSGGTEINLDKSFLTCCECTDNCMDKSKCACWQMTIESTGVCPSGVRDQGAGYANRRLSDHLPTGVFECNSECKCSQQCHNRVVQHGIKLRLQVFKTNKRGWGLRCLDDIPKGAFVCIYAGQIWKEDMANERGRIYGDEYFAELDYIEVVENNKEGYESDVASCDMSDRGYNSSDDESVQEEGSDADYHAGSDSDADYVPKGRGSGAAAGAHVVGGGGGGGSSQSDAGSVEDPDNPKKELSQVSTRLTFRRQTSAQRATEQQWSVVPSGKESPNKVEEWVKDLPPAPPTTLQEANNTTPTKAPSGTASEPDTPTRLYGYNTNPGNVLDAKALDAYRKRKEKEKAMRRRKLDGESPSKPPSSSGIAGDNPITLSSSDEEDSRAHRNTSPASKPNEPSNPSTPSAKPPSTPNGNSATPGGIPTTPDGTLPVTPGASTSGVAGHDAGMNEGGIQGFGGFQIEGITSLAVESDDTDESDTDETKGAKGDGLSKKMTSSQPKSTTQHPMMSLMAPPGPPSLANAQHQGDGNRRAAPIKRTRPFFGEEHHYIMDAKFIGNLGRYLNHSCSPNLFVQNVFVDTHDLRFPWVAFFAHERIRASTELTWDYNYDVGSVPGKSLPCYCGSNVCKGRLL